MSLPALLATEPHLVVTGVYPAGKGGDCLCQRRCLVERIRRLVESTRCIWRMFPCSPDKLPELVQPGDIVLTLGRAILVASRGNGFGKQIKVRRVASSDASRAMNSKRYFPTVRGKGSMP
ncbi:MAG: hypothetical protein Ct9H300mP14_06390 [Gammaproteobacteria bacterium]|nr:MAG: hypothetical protein Ct9H300mP14_06390 [Gammaproteobacteria bacterium]